MIEHKAVTLPGALGLRHVLEVTENTAAQVKHLLEPVFQKVRRGFFAADSTSAKHRDFWVCLGVEIVFHVLRPLAERGGLRVDRALERPDLHLVVVAGVDQRHLRVVDQRVPILRFDVLSHGLIRVHGRVAQRDDFRSEDDAHPMEGLAIGVRQPGGQLG